MSSPEDQLRTGSKKENKKMSWTKDEQTQGFELKQISQLYALLSAVCNGR